MSAVRLVGIVEGHGEEQSLRGLLRRLGPHLDPGVWIDVVAVIRQRRKSIVKPGEIERAIELAARRLGGPGGVLVLLDSDEDCPAQLGPELLARARAYRADHPVAVVLAKPMFEAWFLAAAESLQGSKGLPGDLEPPPNPEAIANPKRWLIDRTPRGDPYSPMSHQPSFVEEIDLTAARTAPSFDKLCRDVARLIEVLRTPSA